MIPELSNQINNVSTTDTQNIALPTQPALTLQQHLPLIEDTTTINLLILAFSLALSLTFQ